MDQLKNNINAAMKKAKADVVLKNASIINVLTQSIETGDLAINGDTIVGIGDYEGVTEIDCGKMYVAPGFIDAHVHIESSMVTPEVFSDLVIKKGVTTIIADPHEIANVMGGKGIQFMLRNSKNACMETYFMLPSCVPAISFEDNGATLKANKLKKFSNHPKVLGLGEVMDVNSVITGNNEMLDKIHMISKKGKHIDGHCPKVDEKGLNAYLCAGIKTDHECTEVKEALDKVRKGMYVMLREGSAAKDLVHLLPAVTNENYHRFLFCTDDRHIEDLMEKGSIDYCIRLAIESGLDPIKAFTIASHNAASCYNLKNQGAIAPGMKADLVVFEDLEKLRIKYVFKDGKVNKKIEVFSKIKTKKSINLQHISKNIFQTTIKGEEIHVIKALPGSLKTTKVRRKVILKNDLIDSVVEEDGPINKITVIERHKFTGKYFTGYIEGLGIKHAAIAQTISHDSHNVVVLGDNDDDMRLAVNTLIDQGGGIVFVSKGKLLEYIELPIAGIMTDQNPLVVLEKMKRLNILAREQGINPDFDPYITLSFMALPVIPDLKITPRGLFDYSSFQFIDLKA